MSPMSPSPESSLPVVTASDLEELSRSLPHPRASLLLTDLEKVSDSESTDVESSSQPSTRATPRSSPPDDRKDRDRVELNSGRSESATLWPVRIADESPKLLYSIWQILERQPWFLDDTLRDPFTLGSILTAPNTRVFFLGPDPRTPPEGLMYAANIIPGLSATSAIVIWGRSAARRVDLARLAAQAVVKESGLHKLYAHIAVPNTRAHSFVRKLGFSEEGLLRSALCYNNLWTDVVMYGMLASELEGTS